MKKILALLLALVMALSLVACAPKEETSTPPTTETPATSAPSTSAPDTSSSTVPTGVKFSVIVTDENGTSSTFEYTSSAATVGEALLAEGLIAGYTSDWGLYVTTVNGITADWDAESAYWAFYINGEYAMTGVDATPLTEGATYSFVKVVSTVADEGVKFSVVVTDENGTSSTFEYTSSAATVGEALLAEGLIAGDNSDWGLYVTTVNGITADWNTENAYWAFYIDGEYAMTGVDATSLTEGATYSFVKTISYTVKGEGDTTFYFTAKDVDGTVTRFEIHTNETTVGAALTALELISGDQSDWGLYVTTVNGITADWDTENAYWAFYINGEYAMTGVDATEITAGATYEMVKTVS